MRKGGKGGREGVREVGGREDWWAWLNFISTPKRYQF